VVDAHGVPIDAKGGIPGFQRVPLDRRPPDPVSRPTIDQSLSTGIRAMDGFLTCGLGQRMGIFAGAGVGKSVLLGMMARNSSADVNVIALIGERGREVNEFIHRDLGPEGLARSVVVLATSDQPALMRVQAAMAATAVAEFFRDQGKNVLLIMDSLTRVAIAQREIGLASGEPPATRGYPPSVFALLPRLVERAGRSDLGSITAYYSVLVEGDDASEPIADTVRGLIDGHTMLSRDIAGQGHYPAIDILQSISRLMNEIVDDTHREAAMKLRRLMSVYRDHQDLISIGAYRAGSNPEVDQAIAARDTIQKYLAQGMHELSTLEASREELVRLATELAT
jgi:FliI/YscN family ATPase